MRSKKLPYDEVISGRITSRDKYLMKKYDIKVRDAVKWYLKYILTDADRIEMEKEKLREHIYNLKLDLLVAEKELEALEKGAIKYGEN